MTINSGAIFKNHLKKKPFAQSTIIATLAYSICFSMNFTNTSIKFTTVISIKEANSSLSN